MNEKQEPRVCVLTPVYNGEKHLEHCIQSVRAQTHTNFEYIIVNNCSTDGTVAIAERFAALDPRIRIHNNTEFLSVVDNHNMAFSIAPEDSKYCKIVGADDWLFPRCIEEMVTVAEANPTIAMVTSYVLVGNRIGWDGLKYPGSFIKGTEICRVRLLDRVLVFGGPSASLLRTRAVKEQQPFYRVGNYHGDNEAYLELLKRHDFGFVHQVLSYNRRGEDSRTTHFLQRVSSNVLADVEEVVRFGDTFLTEQERRACLARAEKRYYTLLARAVLEFRGREFWSYHMEKCEKLGRPISFVKLGRYVLYRLLDMLLNPKRTLESVFGRIVDRRRNRVAS